VGINLPREKKKNKKQAREKKKHKGNERIWGKVLDGPGNWHKRPKGVTGHQKKTQGPRKVETGQTSQK